MVAHLNAGGRLADTSVTHLFQDKILIIEVDWKKTITLQPEFFKYKMRFFHTLKQTSHAWQWTSGIAVINTVGLSIKGEVATYLYSCPCAEVCKIVQKSIKHDVEIQTATGIFQLNMI